MTSSDAARIALTRLSATAMAAALRRGDVSARAVLEAHLARYHACHEALNAVVRTDIPAAMSAADRLDSMAADGRYAGPLHGIPMTVKDTFDACGMPASAGRPDYGSRAAATPDAVLVARLRAAGAVVWGKTNTSYMALGHHTSNPLHGQTSNPFDARCSAGGSSGGSAAAVAACVSPLEIGSDIGGSLRVPAHFCGVCALKPSFGLLPLTGHVPPAPGSRGLRDLDVAGPLARTIGDLRLIMRALATDLEIPAHGPERLNEYRIAIWVAEDGFPVSDTCSRAVLAGEKACAELGAHTARAKPDIRAQQLLGVYMRLLLPVVSVDLNRLAWVALHVLRPLAALCARAHGHGLAEAIVAATASHRDWLRADEERQRLQALLEVFFGSWDAILAPVAPMSAFAHPGQGRFSMPVLEVAGRDPARMSFWSVLASALHLPAVVLPAGLGRDGLPVGVQLIGRQGSDARLLGIAEALSSRLDGHSPALLTM